MFTLLYSEISISFVLSCFKRIYIPIFCSNLKDIVLFFHVKRNRTNCLNDCLVIKFVTYHSQKISKLKNFPKLDHFYTFFTVQPHWKTSQGPLGIVWGWVRENKYTAYNEYYIHFII